MIAVDTNVLVYAHRQDSQFHPAASRKLAELAEGSGAWPCRDFSRFPGLKVVNPVLP